MAAMRVRVAIGLAVLATLGGLLLDMSGSAPRGAGDDHVSRPIFANTVPGGDVLCQGRMFLPGDAASMNILIGTNGFRMPPIAIDFRTPAGHTVATGFVRAGTNPSAAGVTVALAYPHGPSAAGTMCLHVGGKHIVAFGGETFGVGSSATTLNGLPQAGRISVVYMRRGSESWWQLLGALDSRFGLGKSPIFGDWTLPVLALVVLALWIVVVRFVVRELT
jgi:hypothetical protein